MLKRFFLNTSRITCKLNKNTPKPFIKYFSSPLTKETPQDQILQPTTGEKTSDVISDPVALRRLYERYGNPEQVEHNVFAAMLPPIEVEGDVAVCDGADDTSLHPREYIKVFHEYPQECKYCGLAYIRKDKDLTD